MTIKLHLIIIMAQRNLYTKQNKCLPQTNVFGGGGIFVLFFCSMIKQNDTGPLCNLH